MHCLGELPATPRGPEQRCLRDMSQGQLWVEPERLLSVPQRGLGPGRVWSIEIFKSPGVRAGGDCRREFRLLGEDGVELRHQSPSHVCGWTMGLAQACARSEVLLHDAVG